MVEHVHSSLHLHHQQSSSPALDQIGYHVELESQGHGEHVDEQDIPDSRSKEQGGDVHYRCCRSLNHKEGEDGDSEPPRDLHQ